MDEICFLCEEKEATKTNSHIVPSFLGARVFSYDGSGKRGKDIAFTITGSKQRVYTGNLPSDKYEELFDEKNLTDERTKELKIDPLAKDYCLCPECEKLLADHLESPYATSLNNERTIEGDIALYFWMSVIWRISKTKILGDWLTPDVEDTMRKYLFSFLSKKQLKQDTSDMMQNIPFKYKILYSPDYLKSNPGFLNFKTNDTHENAAFICGNIAVFLGMKDLALDFWGLEKYVKDAPFNNGTDQENKYILDINPFIEAKKLIIEFSKKEKLTYERKFLNKIWKKVDLQGEMPLKLQNEILEAIHGDGLKLGDKGEYELWVPIIYKKVSDYISQLSR